MAAPEKAYFDSDWQYTEGVENLGVQWGADRVFALDPAPTAKTDGIRGRRGNPDVKDYAFANGIGLAVQPTDQIWTLWQSTFMADGEASAVPPATGDILRVLEVDANGDAVTPLNVLESWVVRSVKRTLCGAQYRCYCQESPFNQDVLA